MARQANKLNAARVAKLRAPGRYSDGLGLWLQIAEGGSRSWLFRFMRHGRARQMGLGATHTVSLAEARERARLARQILLDGDDPIELRRRKRDEARAATAETILFKDAAEQFLELHKATWKNKKHRQQWGNSLRQYAHPVLGARPISALDAAVINEALAPIWTKKAETARRVKQRIERVIQWVRDGRPLPAKSAAKRVRHHPAMPFADVPAFMHELSANRSISARALEFTILTVARTGDTIGARWREIDLDAGIWTVSDGRHKTGRDFEIPLSKAAHALLDGLPRMHGDDLVFPGSRSKQPLSNMAMLELLRGMREGLTVHGFRSSFRDWSGDQTNFARELIETAMSHQIKDKAEAAYRRSTALEKRRKLMEAWARYCTSPVKASQENVVSIGA